NLASLPRVAGNAGSQAWTPESIEQMRRFIPGMSQLISSDQRVLGIVIRIDNERLNGFRLEKRVTEMKAAVQRSFPDCGRVYAAGIPLLRAAFERYNLENAGIFAGLGLLFGTMVAFVLFRTIWAAGLVVLTALVSLIWLAGLMGLSGIRINMASGLSFGFVLIASCTTVFHILTAYFDALPDHDSAFETALARVLRPCFMCALTTAFGFFSLTVSPVPMVRQAGLLIGLGVLLAFVLALPVTAFMLPYVFDSKRAVPSARSRVQENPSRLASLLKAPGFSTPGITLILGLVFCMIAAAGIPKIEETRHLSLPMLGHSQAAKDMAYVREHLSTGTSVSLVFTDPGGYFEKRQFWYDMLGLEKQLKQVSGVEEISGITGLVFKTALGFSQAGIRPELVFSQLGKHKDYRVMVAPFLSSDGRRIRLDVHIRDLSSRQIEELLGKIIGTARSTMKGNIRVDLAGQMIYLRYQTRGLVAAQVKTLGIALFVITGMMMIQLRSVRLGLLSLIPNLLPLFTIFGIMGWAGIPLDPLTVFAAVISFGLSVDDSIHYLTAVKDNLAEGQPVGAALETAYAQTANALIATTAVLCLASAGLMLSQVSHVFYLGLLVSSASLAALAGDLILLPALVRKTGL
ncbi:MAG: MMPL family transporter, partial [Desulfobacterales bacterium]|nr:MMPL family transporter [Desulfobacterales bacterium]